MADIVSCHDQVLAQIVLAPDDDVAVWVAWVIVINGNSIQLGIQVPLHWRHEITDKWIKCFHLGRIFRRQNDPELVAVTVTALDEFATVSDIQVLGVDLSGFAVARDAIPLEIAEMGACPTFRNWRGYFPLR
jgi:hypothetical protein